jgi:hypothetical protein
VAEYAHTLTARKYHWCDGPGYRDHRIKPGDAYARCVCFPGDDVNQSDRPWTVRICAPCYTGHGKDPMPPRPKSRSKK